MPRYMVEIEYTVPEWDRRQEDPPRPRGGMFVVEAENAKAAKQKGVAEFRSIERDSGVGWHRQIEKVVVQRIAGTA